MLQVSNTPQAKCKISVKTVFRRDIKIFYIEENNLKPSFINQKIAFVQWCLHPESWKCNNIGKLILMSVLSPIYFHR